MIPRRSTIRIAVVLALSFILIRLSWNVGPAQAAPDPEAYRPVAPAHRVTRTEIAAKAVARDAQHSMTAARIVWPGAPVYSSLVDAQIGAPPKRSLPPPGYNWVMVMGTYQSGGKLYYQINPDEFVPASALSLYRPSTFHGVQLDDTLGTPLAFVLVDSRPSPQPGTTADKSTPVLARYTVLPVLERQGGWYRVGDGQWLPQYALALVIPAHRPAAIRSDEQWIEVNLAEQTLAAYEGDRMVYATLVSSGLPKWPTTPGLFRVWIKLRDAPMYGHVNEPDFYYLENVPWIMYFDQDQGLHAAYWHDRFGTPQSHGCVNLAPLDADWLYHWTSPVVADAIGSMQSTPANPGTWVWVH